MIFVELNMKGRQHLLVNAGFIEQFGQAGRRNLVFADPIHVAELKSLVDPRIRMTGLRLPVIRSGSNSKAAAKTILESLYVVLVFILAMARRERIFFLSSYASVKTVIEHLSRIFPVETYLVHHGELTGLKKGESGRFANYVRRYFSNRSSTRLTDVFLSPSLRRNAFELAKRSTPSSIAHLHPYPGRLVAELASAPRSASGRPVVGYFGALTAQNRQRVQAIIDALNRRIEAKGAQDFELRIIAPNSGTLDFGEITGASVFDTTVQLSNEEYSRHVAQFDVVFFPYDAQQYDLIASGIAVDCLIHRIHFFAARSSFFTDWVGVHLGAATLFDSFDALLHSIAGTDLKLVEKQYV